jgi:transcriptional regulator with XRE-family HTH domain
MKGGFCTFWDNFEALCIKKGVAPNAAAKAVGVKSSGTVTGWKNGAAPRSTVLRKMSDYFGVDVSDLTGEEQKEKPSAPEGVDLSSLSPEDAELVRRILEASEAKKNAIRELL